MKNNISNDNIYDACVIGAGASGLVCASELAKRGYSTLLLEQNKKSGRKLYATGNGRCNIANAVLSSSAYYSDGFASQVVNSGSVAMLKRYLEQNGIPLTEKDGYMYPRSLQASSVVWALTDAARLAGVNIRYESRLTAVARTPEGGFRLTTESVKDGSEKEYLCNRLVLSAGSPAGSDLGAAKEGSLEKLLEDLGLPYIPFEPALCPLTVREDVSELAGVRARAVIRIGLSMDRHDLNEELTEKGELQLTDYGISGIAVFNMSTLIQVGEKVSIDLRPEWESTDKVLHFIREQDQKRSLFGILNGLLHEKLCAFFINSVMDEDRLKKPVADFADEEIITMINMIKDWRLTITGKKKESGQACSGGVKTHILSPDTMKVRNDPRIAVTGELCNVTGRCGGYNLMFALISGLRAGQRV